MNCIYNLSQVRTVSWVFALESWLVGQLEAQPAGKILFQQEAFEKCWAHSPRELPHAQSAVVATGTVARHLRIDVHDDNA